MSGGISWVCTIYMPGIMLEAVHVLSLVDITILPVVLRTASEVNSKAEIYSWVSLALTLIGKWNSTNTPWNYEKSIVPGGPVQGIYSNNLYLIY